MKKNKRKNNNDETFAAVIFVVFMALALFGLIYFVGIVRSAWEAPKVFCESVNYTGYDEESLSCYLIKDLSAYKRGVRCVGYDCFFTEEIQPFKSETKSQTLEEVLITK